MLHQDSDVRRQAIDWLFILSGPSTKAADLEEFERWCSHHPSHAAAYKEVKSLLGDSLLVSQPRLTPSMLAKEERCNRIAMTALIVALLGCLAIVLEIPVAINTP
ncbi:DUF4880 domain-containing protein [Rhizobium sp. CFBP 8762]|uniref:FecR/PupR family sigma factor regulator n=1 Tax=Rhizobium sp. CFBP 8762 TaxID=2775279 RepID=UPI00177F5148|nr:DUF4880 domain-containing protein [Rhizobium sp. CFBP 8762]MBD8554223.1 DUF4880 domain-containing protein [Rhizobium sp. CFBP 8762]